MPVLPLLLLEELEVVPFGEVLSAVAQVTRLNVFILIRSFIRSHLVFAVLWNLWVLIEPVLGDGHWRDIVDDTAVIF